MKEGYIFYTDLFLNITSWGRGISLFTGIKPSEAIGEKYYRIINRISLDNKDALSKAISESQTIVFKGYPLKFGGRERRVDLTISTIKDRKGETQGVKVKITHDPSLYYLENLQELSDFFEAVSHAHGLRGPLNTIKGASQFLRDSRPEDNDIKEFTNLIDEAVNQMDNIISRFLNLPVRRLELSDIDINALLKKIKSLTSQRLTQCGIKAFYSYGDIPYVKADSIQIQQAIMNIIDNAIEAMVEGGEIKITSGVEDREEGDFVVVTISDTGPGITSTNKKRRHRHKNSRGFGLTLTRLILHCHGGWMKIDEDKAGTTVRLYLPVERR